MSAERFWSRRRRFRWGWTSYGEVVRFIATAAALISIGVVGVALEWVSDVTLDKVIPLLRSVHRRIAAWTWDKHESKAEARERTERWKQEREEMIRRMRSTTPRST